MNLRDHRRGKYFDEWETVEGREKKNILSDRLSEYIEYARQLEFYKDRLSQADLKSSHPLLKVPVLKPSEFRGLVPPVSEKIVQEDPNNYTVFQSGGTTGVPKTTLFTHEELEHLNLPNARGFYALGLSKEDRVGNLWAVGSLYMTFIHINRMLQQYGCINFPFSNHTDTKFIHTIARQFKMNCLTGVASYVLQLARKFEALGLDGIQIKKVYYGAEHFFESDKKEIREKLGAEIIAAPGYGTVDTWYLGYQCLDCPTGVFHTHDDQVYLEIIDESSGEPCAPGEVGMIYATPYLRKVTPIVRYRVGDRARWIGETCTCGRATPLFKLLGRGDDVLRVGCDSIDYGAIQKAIEKVKGLSGTVQMERTRRDGKDQLTLRIETQKPQAQAAKALEKELLNARPLFRELIEKGNIWPLNIELVGEGTLPRNPKTGKLQRVKDSVEEV